MAFLIGIGPALADGLPRPLTAEDFIDVDLKQARLGQLLFYDRILSGNRNIACSTCHHPDLGTTDGLSLGIGEGGEGLGPNRTPGSGRNRILKRVPRNAPALWNLGARDIAVLFHDGRLTPSNMFGNGFDSPAREHLPKGLANIVAAQAMFPLTAMVEMAGQPDENKVARAVEQRMDYAWPILADRVRAIPEYADRFVQAFDHIQGPQDIAMADIANALSAFIIHEFTSIDSPFDAYLAGDQTALTPVQKAGMVLFYGKAQCSACHAGPLMSDQKFHAIGVPQFGPGRPLKGDAVVRDVGRMRKSNAPQDAYMFRTPMLRNVALTGPYGHNGAYSALEDMVRHHLDPKRGFDLWQPERARLPSVPWLDSKDFATRTNAREMDRQRAAIALDRNLMSNDGIAALVAFLHSLTGVSAKAGRLGIPEAVPSGLPVDGPIGR